MDVKLGGYLPDPDRDDYWGFEELLGSQIKLAAAQAGDVDMRSFSSPRHNQRHTSSCVGQSVIKALEVLRIKKHGHEDHKDLSVMAVYYLARELMSPQRHHIDGGTYISLACDVLKRFGVPTEESWPFNPGKINDNIPIMAMRDARLHKIHSYYRIKSRGDDRVENVVKALRAGHPVVFGTGVHADWFRYGRNDVLEPLNGRDNEGGHATVLLGYVAGLFVGENSWGSGWGDNGFYRMHPDVIADDAHDVWAIAGGWEPHVSETAP
jgi:C1A family cysteine protease